MSTTTVAPPPPAAGPTYPTCPECGATGKSCKRPTGRTTAEWHAARKVLLRQEPTVEASTDAPADDSIVEDLDVQARIDAAGDAIFARIPLELIAPHPSNPRRSLGDVSDLAESIRSQGVLEPLVVGDLGEDGRYVLIAGHRRLAACRDVAGLHSVPCVIRQDLDTSARQLEAMLVENLHRADLSPIEEAEGYQSLLEFPGFTQTTVAREVGQPVSRIRERLKLTKAPEPVKAKLHAGQITITDALATLEFAGNKTVEKTLTKALGTDSFRRELAVAREDAEYDRKLNARAQLLRDQGIKVAKGKPASGARIDQSRYYDGIPLVEEAINTTVDRDPDKTDAWVIDHHAQCPGHVSAFVDVRYHNRKTVAHFCTQPKLHPRPKNQQQRSPEEIKRAKDEAAKRKVIAAEAGVAARMRHDHLREQLLTHKATAVQPRLVKIVMRHLEAAMGYTAAERALQLRALADVFGFELPQMPARKKVAFADVKDLIRERVKVLPLPALVFVLDFALNLRAEVNLSDDSPHGGGVHSSGHDWLEVLAGSYGYAPTAWETTRFALDKIVVDDEEAPVCSGCGLLVEDLGVVEGHPEECRLCAEAEAAHEAPADRAVEDGGE